MPHHRSLALALAALALAALVPSRPAAAARISDELAGVAPRFVLYDGDGDGFIVAGSTFAGGYISGGGFNGPVAGAVQFDQMALAPAAIWISDPGANKIWSMALPESTPVSFAIPTAASGVAGIAVGPDGNLWFTEHDANKVGRLTPLGQFTEFPLPHAASGPNGITAARDGNLWFTEENGNRIGRITPAGTITEFPIPTAGAKPIGIAASLRYVAFTESAANKIGLLNLANDTITEKNIPTANSLPWAIVHGPDDGAFYFTERVGNKIGRMSPNYGGMLEWTIPTVAADPISLSVDSAAIIHFAEYGAGKLGELQVMTSGGDANGDYKVDVADVFYVINFLFGGGPPPK